MFAAAGHQSLALVIAAAALGAFTGDQVSYVVGRRAGDRLAGRLRPGTRRSAAYAWAGRVLADRGATVMVVARYVPGGRTAVTLTAGAVRHPLSSFSLFEGIEAASWATYAALVGFLGGAAFEDDPLEGVLLGLGLGLSVVAAIELLRRVRHSGTAAGRGARSRCPRAGRHGDSGSGPGSSRARRHGEALRVDA